MAIWLNGLMADMIVSMKVTVIGTGFVGVVTSAVMAHLGHEVWGLDIDSQKIAKLNQGKVPFFEPDLEGLLNEGLKNHRLKYSTDYREAIPQSEIIMMAVGTPSAKDGTADLSYVFKASLELGKYISEEAIVVIKSTVPPGTNAKVREIISSVTKNKFAVASVPEFLREGRAVADTLNPDRVVIGATEPEVISKLTKLHEGLGGARVAVTPESAQMAKYTANAYLAQRITFINQIANLCEKNGAKISEVVKVIGFDKRIGSHYWYPGLGYGGSCFPKDVKELAAYAKSIGEGQGLMPKIDELNEERLLKKLKHFEKICKGFEGKRIAVLGLSFKPNTNDVRFAPSLVVVPYLAKAGAMVTVYDPEVREEAAKIFPGVTLGIDPYQACAGAQIIMLLTEWRELVQLDLGQIASTATPGAFLIDTRNQYQKEKAEALGLKYEGIGNG